MEVAELESECPLIIGFDWISANGRKLVVTEPYGLELKRVLCSCVPQFKTTLYSVQTMYKWIQKWIRR